jgi:hypothetical protein
MKTLSTLLILICLLSGSNAFSQTSPPQTTAPVKYDFLHIHMIEAGRETKFYVIDKSGLIESKESKDIYKTGGVKETEYIENQKLLLNYLDKYQNLGWEVFNITVSTPSAYYTDTYYVLRKK